MPLPPRSHFANYHQYPGVADPQAATVQELAKIGDWVNSLPMNHELVAKAAGTRRAYRWDRGLVPRTRRLRPVREVHRYSRRGGQAANLQEWKPAEESWSTARETVREDLVKAGVGAQSTCSFHFARPACHGN